MSRKTHQVCEKTVGLRAGLRFPGGPLGLQGGVTGSQD